MKIHEYQARQLLEEAGVPVPPAVVVETSQDARRAFDRLTTRDGAKCVVVKAQVHAGGRGKGGGVKIVCTADEAYEAAHAILSKPLVTPQTGPEGVKVRRLMVAAAVDISKEYYIGITLDRASACPVLIASSEGGMEIEEVAEQHPDKIIREKLHPHLPLQPYQARNVAYRLGFKGRQVRAAAKIMHQLADLFTSTDASLVEINPLVVTTPTDEHPDGQVIAIDAKMTFDENALFRHESLREMHDPMEENEAELEAHRFGLSYIKLDGNIGCLVNGAGLAMATMDIIKLHGGEPANFLDVGGGASEEAVTEAFKIILSDQNVKGVLVNIFGGIMQCDKIARAIVAAAQNVGFSVPLVVRLEGTNVDQGRKILEEAQSEIPTLQVASDSTEAAKAIVGSVDPVAA
jgi:succinyl-CoA synthetase beta subunit